jgi:hypothetical protein
MKDDYLWDRSGQPDAEVERLERTLGRLRHKGRPLELPRSRPQPRRRLHPALAIAASLALMLLGAAAWLALHPATETAERLALAAPRPASLASLYRRAESFEPSARDQSSRNQEVKPAAAEPERARQRQRVEARQAEIILAKRARERRDERMMKESEQAAEKLMLALRYASSKLNQVQRQIQVNEEHGPAS